ncbi:MAG: hypothetical protein Q7T71_11180 [Herbiconiux sp.]|nr:hypothetical protein [Herbiconiux sp.]
MNVLAAIAAIVLFLLGMVCFAVHTEALVFFAGILLVSASLFVPFSILSTQKR